jgi:hypothetical protein
MVPLSSGIVWMRDASRAAVQTGDPDFHQLEPTVELVAANCGAEAGGMSDSRAKMVDQNSASWNRIEAWLRHISGLRQAA